MVQELVNTPSQNVERLQLVVQLDPRPSCPSTTLGPPVGLDLRPG